MYERYDRQTSQVCGMDVLIYYSIRVCHYQSSKNAISFLYRARKNKPNISLNSVSSVLSNSLLKSTLERSKLFLHFGNRLFYFRKKHIWTYSSKIKVPQFPYCQYVSVYVCTLATANTVWANKLKLEPGSLHMIMSKRIFYFFEIFIFWEDMPLSSIVMHTTGEKGSYTCFDMWSIIIKGR